MPSRDCVAPRPASPPSVYTRITGMNEEHKPSQFWEQRYQTDHTPWDRGGPSEALLGWLHAKKVPSGRILVPGCGRGHEVIELSAAGFQVTGVDFAPSALEELRQRLDARGLRAELVCADFLTWRGSTPFDAAYEQTSLCSLPPHRWRDYVNSLEQNLKPGAKLLALFMQTGRPGGPPWHCDPVAMQRLFKAPVWKWQTTTQEPIAHPIGVHELPALLCHDGGRQR
jgi:methyl halide transferase